MNSGISALRALKLPAERAPGAFRRPLLVCLMLTKRSDRECGQNFVAPLCLSMALARVPLAVQSAWRCRFPGARLLRVTAWPAVRGLWSNRSLSMAWQGDGHEIGKVSPGVSEHIAHPFLRCHSQKLVMPM